MCRGRTIRASNVDMYYLAEVCKTERSDKCEGCQVRKATRAMAMHQRGCAKFFENKLTDLEREHGGMLKHYRETMNENAGLKQDIAHLNVVVDYLSTVVSIKNNQIENLRRDQGHP